MTDGKSIVERISERLASPHERPAIDQSLLRVARDRIVALERERDEALVAMLTMATYAPRDSAFNDADAVLGVLPVGDFHTHQVSQPLGMSRKEFFNAISYLTRRGDISHLGYGRYRRALSQGEQS